MICNDILSVIEKKYPRDAALSWDNVGLLVGSRTGDVRRVYVALDVTDEVLHDAAEWKADLIVTHHPLIFSAMKSVTEDDFIGKRIVTMLRNGISYYAMHTNYDVMGMSELTGRILGFEDREVLEVTCPESEVTGCPEGIGRIETLTNPMKVSEWAEIVKKSYKLDAVRVFGDMESEVKRVAISAGSGGSMIAPALAADCDLLITGDIGHHAGIDAVAQGLSIIDAGHYGIEHVFIHDIAEYLKENCGELDVREAPIVHPFQTV